MCAMALGSYPARTGPPGTDRWTLLPVDLLPRRYKSAVSVMVYLVADIPIIKYYYQLLGLKTNRNVTTKKIREKKIQNNSLLKSVWMTSIHTSFREKSCSTLLKWKTKDSTRGLKDPEFVGSSMGIRQIQHHNT